METIHVELINLLNAFLNNKPGRIVELAHDLHVSIGTIKNWAAGKIYPHTLACPSIIEYLKNKQPAGS